MPLSSGNDANVAQMLDWLRDDEAGPAAVALRDLLGSVVWLGGVRRLRVG
jgi:hypothetical protein